jgi:hypothetical protein
MSLSGNDHFYESTSSIGNKEDYDENIQNKNQSEWNHHVEENRTITDTYHLHANSRAESHSNANVHQIATDLIELNKQSTSDESGSAGSPNTTGNIEDAILRSKDPIVVKETEELVVNLNGSKHKGKSKIFYSNVYIYNK